MGDADKVFVERLDHPVLHPHPTLRALANIRATKVEPVACLLEPRAFARAFVPLLLTLEAGVSVAMFTSYFWTLAILSHILLTPKIWAPDEICVVIYDSGKA